MKNQLGQCTLRLANIRPGLRRIVFRNERDNKENPMAIALVEIRMYTLAEIEEKTATHKARIEVWRPEGFKSDFLKISFILGGIYIYQIRGF